MEELIVTIADLQVGRVFAVIGFAVARPFALTFGFLAFAWGLGASATIRMSVAVAIALPAGIAQLDALLTLTSEAPVTLLATLAAKEAALGYGMGLLLSLPFLAMQYAGAITDMVRGEMEGGDPDPAGGGTLQTYGTLYLTIGFFAFFSLGGMALLVAVLWRSYALFPIAQLLPALAPGDGAMLPMLLQDTLSLAVRIALPLLAVLLAVEAAMAVAARLSQRMGLYDLAFPARNIAALLMLPAMAWLVWGIAQDFPDRAADILIPLQRLLMP